MAKSLKNAQLQIRASKEEKAAIRSAAKRAGMDMSGYVLSRPGAAEFLDHAVGLLMAVKPGYVREGKRLATIAIGCTGGKHRSTAIAVELAGRLSDAGIATQVLHRDLGKE